MVMSATWSYVYGGTCHFAIPLYFVSFVCVCYKLYWPTVAISQLTTSIHWRLCEWKRSNDVICCL